MKESRIVLKDDKKKNMIGDIKKFFLEERDEDLGDLGALLILDFFIEKLGPDIYNQGLDDAHLYLIEKLEDMYGLQI
ncbi:MAG: DUF2164 domain-containing protein [Peptostreptococcaceae bacterium]|nr:DUF2164 domain-containing protein [Peptostreptococcaceae bacterium]